MGGYLIEYMNTLKLENKIREIEKNLPISNDAELLCTIEAVIDAECELHDEERDFELIDEAISMAASLRGVSPNHLEDMANLSADRIIRKIKEEKE